MTEDPSSTANDATPSDVGPSVGCAESRAIESLITSRWCTSVVRFDYTTLAPIGWQIGCADSHGTTTEVEARSLLAPHVAPLTDIAQYKTEARPPAAPWVFFRHPGDFGGIGAVSSNTGRVAFAAGIVWSGRGEIATPSSWRPPSELGNCGGAWTVVTAEGFVPSPEMKDDRVGALLAVTRTGLPRALLAKGHAPSFYVVGYPRTVGEFFPENAEWIVVVESSADAR